MMFRLIVVWLGIIVVGCWRNTENITRDDVQIQLNITGNGTVTGFPNERIAKKGDSLVLYAIADNGTIFNGWHTDVFTTANPLVMVLDTDITINAVFSNTPDDMVFISARDSFFTMGSSASDAYAIERPHHRVGFSYDFYLGAFEVTWKDYKKVMEGIDAFSTSPSDDSLPVTTISWYYAVLYCNQRSKMAGYDTVYSYTARCKAPGECPYFLENLEIHYERFGYRLPTEAEWEYGCRAGSNSDYHWGNNKEDAEEYAWYFDNANNTLHRTGLKRPNAIGLYDISGNAAEWVNDWLGFYADSLYINPVGPVNLTQEQFTMTGQRIIKGGSYRLGHSYLRPSIRKGPYEMTSQAVQVDIGFRLAMGAFNAPSFVPNIIVNDSFQAQIVCNKSDLINGTGTSSVKVVFVYSAGFNHYCAFIDFSRSPVKIIRYTDDSIVAAPIISPDGRFIAWGSKDEGATGKSLISIRSFSDDYELIDSTAGFLPRWWVDPHSSDTFLIYTDGASMNNLAAWKNEKTVRRKISGGVLQGDAEVLWDKGSYHGGLSSDGRFLGTAFPFAKLVDLQLGDPNLFYFLPPWNGRDDTAQVCNLSMSPSHANPGEALFLDFGYPRTSSLLGKSYGWHEVIFFANTLMMSNKHVFRWIETPMGYDRWNYTEYSNHPDIVAAIAQTDRDNDGEALFVINVADSNVTEIVRGNGLRGVHVWVDPADVSEADDPFHHFGKYDVPIQMAGHVTLAKKLRLLWHERENVACVAIGNSPLLYGFDPHSITTVPTINIGWFQSSIGGSIAIAMDYVLTIVPGLKVLIIDLDASYFTVNSGTYPALTGLSYTKGYELDSNNNFYRGGVPGAVIDKAAAMTRDDWNGFDGNGAFLDSIIGEGWGDPIVEGGDYSIDDPVVKMNLSLFEDLIVAAAEKEVTVLAVNFPQNPKYRTTAMAGRAGPSHDTYDLLAAKISGFAQLYPNFYFYDANNHGEHDYTSDEAMDSNHLNSRGGKKLAMRIDSLLKTISE